MSQLSAHKSNLSWCLVSSFCLNNLPCFCIHSKSLHFWNDSMLQFADAPGKLKLWYNTLTTPYLLGISFLGFQNTCIPAYLLAGNTVHSPLCPLFPSVWVFSHIIVTFLLAKEGWRPEGKFWRVGSRGIFFRPHWYLRSRPGEAVTCQKRPDSAVLGE